MRSALLFAIGFIALSAACAGGADPAGTPLSDATTSTVQSAESTATSGPAVSPVAGGEATSGATAIRATEPVPLVSTTKVYYIHTDW